MARSALRPSDFITASKSLNGRLREAGLREQLEGAAGTAASDMARRFAPESPDDGSEPEIDVIENDLSSVRPAVQSRRFPSVPPEESATRARTGLWVLIALIIACGTPSAFAGFMIWNGSLPIPFAAQFEEAPVADTTVAEAPVAEVPVEDGAEQTLVQQPAADTPIAQEPAAAPAPEEAPPPEAVAQPAPRSHESLPPKMQGRMEAAVSAMSDPASKSSIQEKTGGFGEARAAPAPLQIVVKPIEGAHAAMQAELAVAVEPSIPDGAGSRILVKGLPDNATLSAGEKSADGWTLTVDDLTGLKLNLPPGAVGDAMVKVELRSQTGDLLAETGLPLHVDPSPVLRPDYVSRIAGLMEHGQKMIDVGYISGARAYYIRAAEAGSPEGAMAAAATFDPSALEALQAHGVKPDVAQARRWYERAKELGATGAEARLAGLPAE